MTACDAKHCAVNNANECKSGACRWNFGAAPAGRFPDPPASQDGFAGGALGSDEAKQGVEVAQKPVAWRYRATEPDWPTPGPWHYAEQAEKPYCAWTHHEMEPVYAGPSVQPNEWTIPVELPDGRIAKMRKIDLAPTDMVAFIDSEAMRGIPQAPTEQRLNCREARAAGGTGPICDQCMAGHYKQCRYCKPSVQVQPTPLTFESLRAAFDEEIKLVSTVEYNSQDICRWFFGNVMLRLAESPLQPQPSPNHPELPDGCAPKGWRIVPVEPTAQMITAADQDPIASAETGADEYRAIYRAMLAATPLPPQEKT